MFGKCYRRLAKDYNNKALVIDIKTKTWIYFEDITKRQIKELDEWQAAYNPEITSKDIKRLLKCEDIQLLDGRYIHRTSYRIYRGPRPNYSKFPVLKQDSKRKKKNRQLDKWWGEDRRLPPHKRGKDYVDWGFDSISSKSFGHPNLRYTLDKKRQAEGYRRADEKSKLRLENE